MRDKEARSSVEWHKYQIKDLRSDVDRLRADVQQIILATGLVWSKEVSGHWKNKGK